MDNYNTLLMKFIKAIIPLFHVDIPQWNKSRPELVGTGVLIEVNENYYVITAGHVIEQYALKHTRNPDREKDDYDDESDSYLTLDNIGLLCGDCFYPIRRTKFIYGRKGTLEYSLDVAVLYLDTESWMEILPTFNPITQNDIVIDHTIKGSDHYIICGYPACWCEYGNKEEYIQTKLFSLITHGIVDEKLYQHQIDKKYHFLFFYSLDSLRNQNKDVDLNGFAPQGISGCGVWYFSKNTTPKLIGIATEDAMVNYNQPFIIATRIAEVLNLLE